jgi:ribonuclease BN (tRNA processing enzyme)
MKIQLVGSSIGEGLPHQFLNSYLVNESIALDAGSIGLLTPLDAQRRITDVFLSHSHIDHIASLPAFIDNVYQPGPDCVRLYCSREVWDCLRRDLFNDRLWPDVVRLSASESPFVKYCELRAHEPITIGDVQITAVPLNHVVPTFGFLVEQAGKAAAIVSDTAPTNAIWHRLAETPGLRLVFLEASFPNQFQWLAEKSQHLTPHDFAREIAKLPRPVRWVAVHIKPDFHAQIVGELQELNLRGLEIGQSHAVYEI